MNKVLIVDDHLMRVGKKTIFELEFSDLQPMVKCVIA